MVATFMIMVSHRIKTATLLNIISHSSFNLMDGTLINRKEHTVKSQNQHTKVRKVIKVLTGGMIQQNYPNNQPQQGFGWFGGENQQQGNSNNINNQNNGKTPLPPAPPAPSTPSLFLPNFAPPVYYPNTYPYPNYNFPNFNSYPFAPPYNPNHPNGNGQAGGNHNNGQNAVGQNEKNPDVNINRGPNPSQALTTTTQPSIKVNENESHNRHEGQDDDKFLTNAFFGGNVGNDEGSQKVNREWTEADEMKWQATTKAPYFENKVPGLDHCTLPASAVLGEIH